VSAPSLSSTSSPPAPHWLFQKLRWRLLCNGWSLLVQKSPIRPVTILVVSLMVWLFVFGVSLRGFIELRDQFHMPPDERFVGVFLGLLFLALGGLLIFSTGLILYASLFTAAETAFLLSKPVSADHVFAYKFQGSLGFSSWAFLLMGLPVLIAYGLVCDAPWFFYAVLPLFFLGYALLPGCIGALGCLLFVNFIPRRRKEVMVVLIAVLVGLGAWWVYRTVQELRSQASATDEFQQEALVLLLKRIGFARSLILPSAWVSRGLQEAGRGKLGVAAWYLALVWSNGLFLYVVTTAAARMLYRRGVNRLSTGGDLRRRHGGVWLDNLLSGMLPFVHPGTRLLIVKDFRTFRRDPQQWVQVVLFTGLLMLYFANLPNLQRYVRDEKSIYKNVISFLNLMAIGLLLCSYTGRFIYPLLSLEGRKFWILGLVPIRREQILWGKFAFSTTGGLLLAGVLVVLSDWMLGLPPDGMVLHALTVGVLAAGLSGLSVGLGACMPDFRQTDPSKIAAGFGGTLNLVAGLLFLVVTLSLIAAPWHLMQAVPLLLRYGEEHPAWILGIEVGSAAVGLLAGALAVALPLRAGVRSMRDMEF
jgi:ABC-2 type transport system permease protein